MDESRAGTLQTKMSPEWKQLASLCGQGLSTLPFLGPLHTDGKGKKHFGNLAYIFTDELAWQSLSVCLVTGVETKATLDNFI